jgi:hypothetical protein
MPVVVGDLDLATVGAVAMDADTSYLSLPARDSMATAHSALASALTVATTCQREHAAAFVWQYKATADALERDHATTEQQLMVSPTTPVLLDTDDTYEASVIANFHAQATYVQNMQSLVPIVLDPLSSHYARSHALIPLILQ